jgi:hypothetical protein
MHYSHSCVCVCVCVYVCVGVCVCVCVYVQGLKKPMKTLSSVNMFPDRGLKRGFPNIKRKYYEFSLAFARVRNLRKYKVFFLIFGRVEKQK